jgi:hypothetical protein
MRNDFKTIVFKQLTILIKTQNDTKIKVSSFMNLVARINKMLHYMLKMIINTTTGRYVDNLIKMSAFDWSMTRWYKTHATGW